jgi:hypothetical protein
MQQPAKWRVDAAGLVAPGSHICFMQTTLPRGQVGVGVNPTLDDGGSIRRWHLLPREPGELALRTVEHLCSNGLLRRAVFEVVMQSVPVHTPGSSGEPAELVMRTVILAVLAKVRVRTLSHAGAKMHSCCVEFLAVLPFGAIVIPWQPDSISRCLCRRRIKAYDSNTKSRMQKGTA